MSIRQKLELAWISKDARPKLAPCILLGDPEKSCRAIRDKEKQIADAKRTDTGYSGTENG